MDSFFDSPDDGGVSPSNLLKKAVQKKHRNRHTAQKHNKKRWYARVKIKNQSQGLHRSKSFNNQSNQSKEKRVQQWLESQAQANKKKDTKRKLPAEPVKPAQPTEPVKPAQPAQPAHPNPKKAKLCFLQLMGTAKKQAEKRTQLYGSTTIKRRLIQTLVPVDRGAEGFRAVICGPSGCGKSFLMKEIEKRFTNVLNMRDVLMLKRSKLDIPLGRRTLVCIDDVEGMSPEAMAYIKDQMIDTKPLPHSSQSKRKRKKRAVLKALAAQNQKVKNSTSYLFSCRDVYQLSKALRWMKSLYTVKLYAPWESELMSYASNEIKIEIKTADGRMLTRRPFQRDIRKAAQACRRNFRQLEYLLKNPGASASDERMNVFEEAKAAMTSSGRFGLQRLTDTAKEMLMHNIYDNLSKENQLGHLCNALDTLSLGNTMGTSMGEFIADNCFAGTTVRQPKCEFPSDTFRMNSCIRERRELQHKMSQFWCIAGGTGGRKTLSVGELKFRHVHQLQAIDTVCVQDAVLQSRGGPSLIPHVDDWMYKTI